MIEVKGHWAAQWQPVAQAFADNFAEAGEEGAALAVYRDGECLLSLWAGEAAPGEPWQEATRTNLFSASKALVALSVLQLAAAGELDLDRPLADYWPDFGQAGKRDINARHLLCHRSGVSALHQRVPDQSIFDWSEITRAVARTEPWWTPGEAQGYSPFLFGWALGELVRRVSDSPSFGAYVAREMAQPLGLTLGYGLDPDGSPLAQMRPLKQPLGKAASQGADSQSLGKIMKSDPRGVTNRAFTNPMSLMTASNSDAWRAAEIPAANAHGSALDLATLYGALAHGGALHEGRILPESAVGLCNRELSFEFDRVLGLPLRFGHGFMLSQDRADCRFGPGSGGFGHPGAGGCLGFADPDYALGFGYVTNRMGQQLLIDPRAQSLIHAVYQCLEDCE